MAFFFHTGINKDNQVPPKTPNEWQSEDLFSDPCSRRARGRGSSQAERSPRRKSKHRLPAQLSSGSAARGPLARFRPGVPGPLITQQRTLPTRSGRHRAAALRTAGLPSIRLRLCSLPPSPCPGCHCPQLPFWSADRGNLPLVGRGSWVRPSPTCYYWRPLRAIHPDSVHLYRFSCAARPCPFP